MAMGEVKVRCRKCGKPAAANELVLDNDYKMMICRDCVKEKRRKAGAEEAAKKPEKPAGWDKEDEYLAKVSSFKQLSTVQAMQRLSDTKIKVACSKCSYQFNYDSERKYPKYCPTCGREVVL